MRKEEFRCAIKNEKYDDWQSQKENVQQNIVINNDWYLFYVKLRPENMLSIKTFTFFLDAMAT